MKQSWQTAVNTSARRRTSPRTVTILVAMPKSARRTTTARNAVRSYEHRIVSNTLCLFLDIGTVYAICWYSKRHFSVQDRLIFYCWLQPAIRKQAPWYHTSGTLRPKYSVLCTKKGSALPVLWKSYTSFQTPCVPPISLARAQEVRQYLFLMPPVQRVKSPLYLIPRSRNLTTLLIPIVLYQLSNRCVTPWFYLFHRHLFFIASHLLTFSFSPPLVRLINSSNRRDG